VPAQDHLGTCRARARIWTRRRARYGEKALEESDARADELAAANDHNGVACWEQPQGTEGVPSMGHGPISIDPRGPWTQRRAAGLMRIVFIIYGQRSEGYD
jgi:hypothetical protein